LSPAKHLLYKGGLQKQAMENELKQNQDLAVKKFEKIDSQGLLKFHTDIDSPIKHVDELKRNDFERIKQRENPKTPDLQHPKSSISPLEERKYKEIYGTISSREDSQMPSVYSSKHPQSVPTSALEKDSAKESAFEVNYGDSSQKSRRKVIPKEVAGQKSKVNIKNLIRMNASK
jgi:hypothetical protein